MFDRYTDRSRRVIVLAQEHARTLRHPVIDVDHLLLGLAAEGGGVAYQALDKAGVTAEDIWTAIAAARPPAVSVPPNPPFTIEAKRALEDALKQSLKLGHNFIGTEHLILGVLAGCEAGPGSPCAQLLEACGATPAGVREAVMALLRGYGEVPAAAADDDPRMADVAAKLRDIGRQINETLQILGYSA